MYPSLCFSFLSDAHLKGLFVSIDTTNLHEEGDDDDEDSEEDESSHEF